MLNLYFVFGSSYSMETVAFYRDDNDYGVPVCRNKEVSLIFSSQEMEEFLKEELCRVRQEATLYTSKYFDPSMVQRVVDSLNQRGWCFHIGTGDSDLPAVEDWAWQVLREYED